MPAAPPISALLISVLSVLCTALLLLGFRYGLRRSGVPPEQRSRATPLPHPVGGALGSSSPACSPTTASSATSRRAHLGCSSLFCFPPSHLPW